MSAVSRPLSAPQRARRSLRRILAIASKERMHIFRDLATLYFTLLMPLILLALFGYAVSFDLDRIKTVVVDQDRSDESRELTSHLFSGPTFLRVGELERPEDVEPLFRQGRASIAVVIPRGYARSVGQGDLAHVQILVDAADNTTAATVLSYSGRFALATNRSIQRETLGATSEVIEARVRALYNPSMRSILFLLPGLIALIQSMMGVLLTSLTVAREWERGSMEQLFSTPVQRIEIVLGKLIPYFIVAILQLLLILVASTTLFRVPIRGSLLLLSGLSLLFLLATLGQGLLISVITKNQMLATLGAAMTSMLPSMLLSGFIMPIENMPPLLQYITRVIPARYYVSGLRGILLRGVDFATISGDALALALFSLFMLVMCNARFSRSIA
jgi:ABC-2 type transport system permease protein